VEGTTKARNCRFRQQTPIHRPRLDPTKKTKEEEKITFQHSAECWNNNIFSHKKKTASIGFLWERILRK